MRTILIALFLGVLCSCGAKSPVENNILVDGPVPVQDVTAGPDVVVTYTACVDNYDCRPQELCYLDVAASEAQDLVVQYCRRGCEDVVQSSDTVDVNGHTITDSWTVDSCTRDGDDLQCGADNLCHSVVVTPSGDDDSEPAQECDLGSCESTGECTGALGSGYACLSGCCEEVAVGDDDTADDDDTSDDDVADDDVADDDVAVCELGSCASTDECTDALGSGYVCRAGCCSSVSPSGDDDTGDDDDSTPPEPTFIEVTCYFAAAHATEGALFNISWSTSTTREPESWQHRWDLPLNVVDGVAVGTVSVRRADVTVGFWVELTDGSYSGRNWIGVAGTPNGCRIDGEVVVVSTHRPDCGFAIGDAADIDGC